MGYFSSTHQTGTYFKKTQIRYEEASEKNREEFVEKLANIKKEHPEKLIYYIDEMGIDQYIYRPKARAKRGVKVYGKVRGRKFQRLSIVAGKRGKHIVEPMVFKGTADSLLFEIWFDRYFCPKIAGNIAVMDNASIHRKAKLIEIANKYGITIIFLPAYSPDLNKIEGFWAWLKEKLRSTLLICHDLMDAICYCFQLE